MENSGLSQCDPASLGKWFSMFLKYTLSSPSQIQVPEEYHILHETPTSENEGDTFF